jgi:hypothetical protein
LTGPEPPTNHDRALPILARRPAVACLHAVKRLHEANDLGIAMQLGELVKVGHREPPQHQPLGFD